MKKKFLLKTDLGKRRTKSKKIKIKFLKTAYGRRRPKTPPHPPKNKEYDCHFVCLCHIDARSMMSHFTFASVIHKYKGHDGIILYLCPSFRYKESFSHLASRRRESVTAFNDMLVDMCDALWRNKAFSNPTQGSLKSLSASVSPVLCSLGISYPSSRFSIFQGQAFLCQAWNFFLKVNSHFKIPCASVPLSRLYGSGIMGPIDQNRIKTSGNKKRNMTVGTAILVRSEVMTWLQALSFWPSPRSSNMTEHYHFGKVSELITWLQALAFWPSLRSSSMIASTTILVKSQK